MIRNIIAKLLIYKLLVILKMNSTYCKCCNKHINEKPWFTCTDYDGSHINLCSYICTRRFPLQSFHYKNTVNKEDFEEYMKLQPVFKCFKKDTILSVEEENGLNIKQSEEYNYYLYDLFMRDESMRRLYNEQHDTENTENDFKQFLEQSDGDDY